MRRWLSERFDHFMFPLIKLASPGYRKRMGSCQAPCACELTDLQSLRPPTEINLWRERPWRGFQVRGYRFVSPAQCSISHNQSVCGRLLLADEHRPWTVIVPGYATGAFWPYDYGIFQNRQGLGLLRRSVNVAIVDLPFHMGRKPIAGRSGEGFMTPNLAETQQTFRQAAADVVALVRFLAEQSGRKVGLWGTSLGGGAAGLAATCLPDLAALALLEPLDNPGDIIAVQPYTYEIRQELVRSGLQPAEVPVAMRSVAPSSYPPPLPPDRILFAIPQWDQIVPTRFQERFWEAWGRPERITLKSGHIGSTVDRGTNDRICDFLAHRVL